MTALQNGGSGIVRNVQILRGVAALLVVLVHLDKLLSWLNLPPLGYGGVDIFFVISGFIMVYTTHNRETKSFRFMADRIVRIVPAYWAVTLAVFGVALLAPMLLQATQPDWIQLFKSLAFVPFQKTNGHIEPVLFVGWTLNYEMFFYFLFAVGLAFPNKKLGAGSVMFWLACLVGLGLWEPPAGVIGRFYSSTIMLDFALGMIVGLTCWKMPGGATVFFRAATALFAFSCFGAVVLLPALFPDALPFLVCGLPASLLVAGVVALERWGWSAKGYWLLSVGNASYSIYLIHPFVTQPVQVIARHIQPTATVALFLIAVALIGVCVIGVITHHILERPLSNWLRRMLKMPRLNPLMVRT